eukprot:scaffold22604_cov130-Cylindrotheca_fusiformis.AAC.13
MDHKRPKALNVVTPQHEEPQDDPTMDNSIMEAIDDMYSHTTRDGILRSGKPSDKHLRNGPMSPARTDSFSTSHSIATGVGSSSSSTVPPPPPTSGLRRNGYLQAAPGAVRVPGWNEPQDEDATIAIGDDNDNDGVPTPLASGALLPQPAAAAVEQSSSPIQATVQTTSPSLHGTKLLNAMLVDKDEPVHAEVMDAPKRQPCYKDRRACVAILISIVVAVGLAAGLAVGLGDNDNSSTSNGTSQELTMPTLAPSQPPLLYSPPSPDQCFNISRGLNITEQELMMDFTARFHLDIDVILLNNSSNASSNILEEIEEALQSEFAPALAGCEDSRRRSLRHPVRSVTTSPRRRFLLEKYIIGNAFFTIEGIPPDETCEAAAGPNCLHVEVGLVLYMKGETESRTSLIVHIFDVFEAGGLDPEQAYPFNISLSGVENDST